MRKAVEKLKTEALADINRIHCFLINTRMGYALAREKVKEGHDQPADDPRWAVSLEIVANFEFYEHRLLPKTAFLHAVGIFESFLFEFFRIILEGTPKLLPEEIAVQRGDLTEANSREEVLRRVVQRFLDDLHKQPVCAWLDFTVDTLRLSTVGPEEQGRLCEVFAARDQLFKSNPVVDEDYVRSSGQSGRWRRGATAELTVNDFNEACRLLQSLVTGLCDETLARLRPKNATAEDEVASSRVG